MYFGGDTVIGDVSVTDPTCKTYVQRAARTPGRAAAHRDSDKCKYYARAGAGSFRFEPLSIEVYGRMGKFYDLLVELAEYASMGGSVSKSAFLRTFLRDISTSLCRGVAAQVRAAGALRQRLAGRPALTGLAHPSPDPNVDLRAACD